MSSRRIPFGLILAILLAALPVAAARASTAPADFTATATADSTVTPPASEPAPPPSASEPKSESKDEAVKEEAAKEEAAKDEAKDATKAKKAEEAKAAREAKKAKDAAKKAAKKSVKKTEAATKGTVTPVETAAQPGTMPVKPNPAPQRVQVQHILIGFTGSVPGKMISRNKDEAKKLAYEILDRARKGEDFNELVAKYTDDSPPGIYGMCEKGLQPAQGEYPRDGMVAAFGNVGFNISPGNIGIADYDTQASPFGWHVIKRLK